ncbi:MAG: hypothetical protein V4641_31450 [Pseudomonadota bacterium]
MMTSTAVKERAARLEKMARAAITQYNADMAAGGEPIFPEWTRDVIGFIADYDQMVATLARQKMHLVNCRDFETGETKSSVVQIQRAAS